MALEGGTERPRCAGDGSRLRRPDRHQFSTGAWVVVLIIPLIILLLRKIHRHYERFAKEIEYTGHAPLMFFHHAVVVPANTADPGTSSFP